MAKLEGDQREQEMGDWGREMMEGEKGEKCEGDSRKGNRFGIKRGKEMEAVGWENKKFRLERGGRYLKWKERGESWRETR